ncbi:MAG: hypothetical protein H8E44_31505 [Planctomycetes bacterium]|nr:hypothetical protein [Planctomycetota bacterium]MBL7041368.1 hypothetical protein [Pirellulaceae bacterium]
MLYDRRRVSARAPVRVSFVGGGTDFPDFFRDGRTGHVVSAAVDLYCYVDLKDMFDANVRVHHARIETEPTASRITHPYARTALEAHGLFRGVELVITSDVMTTGSGLGASSSVMAALTCAARGLRGDPELSPAELAQTTYRLETEAGTVGGLQDQYATAFGGINSITLSEEGVAVRPLKLAEETIREMGDRMLLVYTNLSRQHNEIQTQLRERITEGDSTRYLDAILQLSYQFLEELERPSVDFGVLAQILDESWARKRELTDAVSNPYVDQLYALLRQHGVIGAKLLGAGGGGFILAIAEAGAQEAVMHRLYPNFIALTIRPTDEGARIVWRNT